MLRKPSVLVEMFELSRLLEWRCDETQTGEWRLSRTPAGLQVDEDCQTSMFPCGTKRSHQSTRQRWGSRSPFTASESEYFISALQSRSFNLSRFSDFCLHSRGEWKSVVLLTALNNCIKKLSRSTFTSETQSQFLWIIHRALQTVNVYTSSEPPGYLSFYSQMKFFMLTNSWKKSLF